MGFGGYSKKSSCGTVKQGDSSVLRKVERKKLLVEGLVV
jgi:hypothetical protein